MTYVYVQFSDGAIATEGIGGPNGEDLTVRQRMILERAYVGPASGGWRAHLDGVCFYTKHDVIMMSS